MSKYTTQVRFICETEAGYNQSQDALSVDQVIAKSWNKIFTTNAPLYDENHRQELCSKILKHYYLREIGCETVGIWKLWCNTKLEEILPYYNKMYESVALEFDPLEDVNVSRKHNRGTQGGNNSTSSAHTENSADATNWELFSDTPQGSVQNLENETYLTNATKQTNVSSSDTDSGASEENRYQENEDFDETVKGKQGTGTYSEMVMKYREAIINVDMMIIDEFKDLFMGLW